MWVVQIETSPYYLIPVVQVILYEPVCEQSLSSFEDPSTYKEDRGYTPGQRSAQPQVEVTGEGMPHPTQITGLQSYGAH
jgi:hypothetical protein